jgi:phospholipid/cholesterol/gamma-HCH transport system substrate-binding protein
MQKAPEISEKIDKFSTSAISIMNNIDGGSGSLSKLINQDELYNNINGLVLDARLLLDDVKNNPTKYLKAYFNAKKK